MILASYNVFAQGEDMSEDSFMKQYFFVLLKKGANRQQDSLTVIEIQKGHLDNIDKLYKQGKIDIAGPFLNDTDWRGLFIFNAESEEEVRMLLRTDPAISSGRLEYEIHPWYSRKGAILR